MTEWVENPTGGRTRGPRGLASAWADVLLRPRSFFEDGIARGDQAPGITFLATVVLFEEAIRFALVADSYPTLGGRPALSAVFWLLVAVVFVAPAVVHLTAALQTLLLMATVEDRAGVSETVQVLCYATTPCVLAGVPVPEVRLLCVLWGSGLYVFGTSAIHEISIPRATLLGAIPALLVFGYGFRGLAAARSLADEFGLALLVTPF